MGSPGIHRVDMAELHQTQRKAPTLIGASAPHPTSVRNSAPKTHAFDTILFSFPSFPFFAWTVTTRVTKMPHYAVQTPGPPRRKSCEACKSAKRRCDLAFPTCSRCIHKSLPCFYPGRLPQTCADAIADIPTSTSGDLPYTFVQSNTPYNSVPLVDLQTLHPPIIDSPFRSISIIPPHEQIDLFEGIPVTYNFDSAMTRANPPKRLSDVLANRLQFAVDVLQNIPRMLVMENQTPWSHRQLYKGGMSKDMQGSILPPEFR